MMKKLTIAFTLALVCISLLACDKERSYEHPLVGEWREMDLSGVFRTVIFTNDQKFHVVIADMHGYATIYLGSYQLDGDKLKMFTQEMVNSEPRKPAVKTASNVPLYENATFSIAGDILTMNYISYPADAPVSTTAKFRKAVPVDYTAVSE